jgi:hypothetical protein
MRLIDFQIYFPESALTHAEQLALNRGLFPTYEAIRLWLKERRIDAPAFRKIAIEIQTDPAMHEFGGLVTVVLSLCMVKVNASVDEARARGSDPAWIGEQVRRGLDAIRAKVGWSCEPLVEFTREVERSRPTCRHLITKFTKTDRRTRTRCEVWMEADRETSRVVVRAKHLDGTETETVVAERSGSLFLEHSFPIATAHIHKHWFVLMEKDGHELVRVPFAPPVPSRFGERA